jgi:hypothetical protein
MKTDVLDTLFKARDAVSDMIISLTPVDAGQKKLLEKLMQRRDQLTAAIQNVINAEFTKSTAALTQEITKLEGVTEQLRGLASSIDKVTTAIGFIDQVLQLVASIIALAA